MGKSILSTLKRMLRASLFEAGVFTEAIAGRTSLPQAGSIVVLAGLATGIGVGEAGFFRMSGAWFPAFLVAGLSLCLMAWILWSLCAWLIGKVLSPGSENVTLRTVMRIAGLALSPGVLGLLVFIPKAGGLILLLAVAWVFVVQAFAIKQAFRFSALKTFAAWAGSGLVIALILVISLVIWGTSGRWFGGNLPFTGSFDAGLNAIVQPYRFSLGSWELLNAPLKIVGALSSSRESGNSSGEVLKYFASGMRAQSDVDAVEKILENQITQQIAREDLAGFPPVNLQLTPLPMLLVISPRDHIETTREIFLDPELSLRQIADIENAAERLGVSALVVEIGGFGGAYPSMVTNNSSLSFTIDASVEEWLHQYLAFRPLGFRYVMDLAGIQRNYEVATINEAVAGMVSQEIGAAVKRYYYSDSAPDAAGNYSEFYDEMRVIRLAVDDYLANGQIQAAEQFMEQKRQELARQGYFIRKLNQAYFAWHGTYADQPGSVSPIGGQLRDLRTRCSSLKQFLDIVSQMTSARDLTARLDK